MPYLHFIFQLIHFVVFLIYILLQCTFPFFSLINLQWCQNNFGKNEDQIGSEWWRYKNNI